MPMRMFVQKLAIRDPRPRPTHQEYSQALSLTQVGHDPDEKARANVPTRPGLKYDEFFGGI